MTTAIPVIKNDHQGTPVFTYPMQIVTQTSDWICVQGHFNVPKPYNLGLFTIENGDHSLEWFYHQKYYNIFRVYAGDNGNRLKGFYCNITRPPIITPTSITADDLALDVLVSPNGEIALHDEDDFNALNLSADEHQHALNAVQTLRNMVNTRQSPFDVVGDSSN